MKDNFGLAFRPRMKIERAGTKVEKRVENQTGRISSTEVRTSRKCQENQQNVGALERFSEVENRRGQ